MRQYLYKIQRLVADFRFVLHRDKRHIVEYLFLYSKRKTTFTINTALILLWRMYRQLWIFATNLVELVPKKITRNFRKTPAMKYARCMRASVLPTNLRFIKNGLSVETFFELLNNRKLNYVVLADNSKTSCLFKTDTPIEFLINDEQIELIEDLVDFEFSHHPINIYTVRGTKGYGVNGMPYLNVFLSEELLKTKIRSNNIYVLSNICYFYYLSYKYLFQELPQTIESKSRSSCNITKLEIPKNITISASNTGLTSAIDVPKLIATLKEQGFFPAQDTLSKYNLSYIDEVERNLLSPSVSDSGELACFVLRKRAHAEGFLPNLLDLIDKENFELILCREINEKTSDFHHTVRGGNWAKGPYFFDGGLPAVLIVAFDYDPRLATAEHKNLHPEMSNTSVHKVKKRFRDMLLASKIYKGVYNGLHSADNETEALDYIKNYDASLLIEVEKEVKTIRQFYSNNMPVVKTLSKSRKSAVQVVRYKNELAVKKTYTRKFTHLMNREIEVLEKFGGRWGFMPSIIVKSDRFFIIPYYDNILVGLSKKERIRTIRKYRFEVQGIIRKMYECGYTFIDFNPNNLIITRSGKVIAIDFEYVQMYANKPPAIDNAYEIAGIPKNYDGDLPRGLGYGNSNFAIVWGEVLGSWASD